MDKELMKEILLDQEKVLKLETIKRNLLKELKKNSNNPFVIIVSGVRRCGKSTLLNQIRTKDCYFVNFDDDRLIDFTVKDFQLLYETLIELYGKKEIFMFDEIQNIPSWERFVRRLRDKGKKVYITGSNASMLSKELGSHLTGRHLSYELYPFSFEEFLRLKEYDIGDLSRMTPGNKAELRKLFNEFIKAGGFPEYLHTGNKEYLKTLYANILYRDIITRYKLPSEKPLKETVYYVASNIGKELSFNKIKNLVGLTSATTVREYFEYLENSYLIFLISKYDPSLKKQIYSSKKAYMIDTGLANIVGFRPSDDEGRLIENIVFLQLKRMKKEIYFHKGDKECDFLIREGLKITQAIQVTVRLNKENEGREVGGLVEAMKKYGLKEGLILTKDEERVTEIEGLKIKVKSLWKWLLER